MSTAPPLDPWAVARRAPRVTVVGDLMLDGWWSGRSERISREAPAPVVEVEERRYAPGGAANTAMNLAALGARVSVVGVVGTDRPGQMLADLLEAAGVNVEGLVRAGSTTTKNRILSNGQILVRLDEVHHTDSAEVSAALSAATAAALGEADALLVCDYGSGGLLSPVREALGQGPRPGLLVVDAHDPLPWAPLTPDAITPNAAEAFAVLGRPAPPNGARLPVLATSATELATRTGARTVLVTLDRDGSVLLADDGIAHRTYARPAAEQQATGAGDTFVAALTAARASGLAWTEAADLAQAAADVVVRRPGTAVCSTAELVEHLGQAAESVLDHQALAARISTDRAAGRRVVLTNGCFDVLHRGHTTYLAQAARLGDVLVVALNSDSSVRRLKGPERPINAESDRAGVIAALGCVSYVTLFDTDTPIPLLELLRPEVYAKGGDYSPDMLAEAEVVRGYGGEVRILDYVPSQSTTNVVDRIRASAGSARSAGVGFAAPGEAGEQR